MAGNIVWVNIKEKSETIRELIHPYFKEYGLLATVTYYLGILLMVLAFLFVIPGFIALVIDRSWTLALCFFYPAIVTGIVGFVLFILFERTELYLGAAITLAALTWLIYGIIGGLPFWLARQFFGPDTGLIFINSVFESMSGWTATGLDTYGMRVEGLPYAILFWRSLIQWVGGVGVILLFLSILVVRSGTVAHRLYLAEGRSHRLLPSVVKTTRRIWAIYAGYTGLLALILFIVGMPLFDSINHSMTALATGGFSVKNFSIMTYRLSAHPNALYMELAIIPFMIIGGISFAMHYQLFIGNIKTFFKNIEVRTMFVIVIISTIILAITLGFTFDSLRYGSFQVITALTGTGFNTAAVGTWTDFQKFILTILMIFGGGYGSTASALKLIRVAVLFYALIWLVRKMLLPESVVHKLQVGNKFYRHEEIMEVATYAVLYLVVLVSGALVFMYGGHSAADALFEVASAEGNVGLSVGITGPNMPTYQKIVLIIEMWAGRLEIFPVLVLITAPFE
ncbi:MAG: TrkH family potassium uptake protein [Candidatus Thermoplasmatota archaeon]